MKLPGLSTRLLVHKRAKKDHERWDGCDSQRCHINFEEFERKCRRTKGVSRTMKLSQCEVPSSDKHRLDLEDRVIGGASVLSFIYYGQSHWPWPLVCGQFGHCNNASRASLKIWQGNTRHCFFCPPSNGTSPIHTRPPCN